MKIKAYLGNFLFIVDKVKHRNVLIHFLMYMLLKRTFHNCKKITFNCKIGNTEVCLQWITSQTNP
jgi:hypothetical protein